MDNSNVGAATRLFADFLWSNIYKDSRKFYYVKNLYITTLWKKDMRELFPQSLFIYYYGKFKKLVIF
jgi:hypothetical protein